MSKHIYEFNGESLEKKTMSELIILSEALFDERDEYNKGKGLFDKAIGRDDSKVIKFYEIFNKVKKCVEEDRFTDGFEQALLLKMHLATNNIFHSLVGDSSISNLFGAMARIVTSRFFVALENIESKLKLNGEFTATKLLD